MGPGAKLGVPLRNCDKQMVVSQYPFIYRPCKCAHLGKLEARKLGQGVLRSILIPDGHRSGVESIGERLRTGAMRSYSG
jgi:hypothetical protein